MADTTKVPGEVRKDFGKGYARRIRKADKIPAVIYGAEHDPIHVSLPGHDMMLISRNANAVIEVTADDGQDHLAMLKEIQRHPIRPEIVHIDLLTVKRGQKVEVDLPINVTGEVDPSAIYTQEETTITVMADALNVPEQVELNIEARMPGEHALVSDIDVPNGVEVLTDPETMVINVSEPIEQDLGEEPETDEETEEGAEGESGEESGDSEGGESSDEESSDSE
ncbi:50S ribosomal protein L25/general stress protein Ctc [Kocuria palustris]|uniref:50S ribosomal protein L25/general stress protein Ctc n=1 Tax=Kocuria palustris TaxID=71999 RepID=UPI0011AA13DE|nr:50S ribosomal protein L25/general stress protein Ctc [Kocuria palustris]